MQNNNIFFQSTEKDSINFHKEWLKENNYELKLLILTSILAESNLAYRGTLTDICNWLGIKNSHYSNKNIKKAIENLTNRELIFYKKDGYTYTITISEKGMKEKEIIKIRKVWINAFKTYNKDINNRRLNNKISIDWINIVKVFVYLYSRKDNNIITMNEISEKLMISTTTVQTAIKAIEACKLSGIHFYKNTIKNSFIKGGETYYINIGSDIGFMINFEDK